MRHGLPPPSQELALAGPFCFLLLGFRERGAQVAHRAAHTPGRWPDLCVWSLDPPAGSLRGPFPICIFVPGAFCV